MQCCVILTSFHHIVASYLLSLVQLFRSLSFAITVQHQFCVTYFGCVHIVVTAGLHLILVTLLVAVVAMGEYEHI